MEISDAFTEAKDDIGIIKRKRCRNEVLTRPLKKAHRISEAPCDTGGTRPARTIRYRSFFLLPSVIIFVAAGIVLSIGRSRATAGYLTVDDDAQAKALRLRMYVLCPECARLIDLAEGNRPQRDVEGKDIILHAAEEHDSWLEMIGINE